MKQVILGILGGITLICATTLLACGASEVQVAVIGGIAIQVMNMILTSSVEKKVNGHLTALTSKIPQADREEQNGD